MKKNKKFLLLVGLIVLVLIGIHRESATNIIGVESIYNEYANKLEKYEMIFVYPKEKASEIEKIKNELEQIYNLAQDKLIVTYMEYDKSDCKNSIIADIELQGDISYKSIVFVYTNTDMCNSIQYAMQNTTSSLSKHKEGFARQKIITIPTDKEAKKSMEQWNKQRDDWFNHEYTTNTTSAIKEMYNILDITKKEVEEANKKAIENNDDKITVGEIQKTEDHEENKDDTMIEYANEDIRITHKVQRVQIVLSNGMIVAPDNIYEDMAIKTIGLNSSTVHGAKVYIQYIISVEKINVDKNIEISNITVKCKNDKLTYEDTTRLLDEDRDNKSQGWIQNNGEIENTIQIGESTKIVGYQVITNGMELLYENEITNVKYEKTIKTINEDKTIDEFTEIIEFNKCLKSDLIKIEEE